MLENQENHIEEELTLEDIDFILPDDFEEEEEETTEESDTEELDIDESTEEVEEAEEVEETETEETAETETEKEFKLSEMLGFEEFKFNHEVGKVDELSADDVKRFLQLGMKEDRDTNAKLDQVFEFEEVAEMFGMSVKEVVETLKDQYFTKVAQEKGSNFEDVKYRYNNERQSREDKQFERLAKKYPDVDTKNLPKQVINDMKSGEDLVKAYEKYQSDSTVSAKDQEINQLKTEMAELKKQLEVVNQNSKTKKKAVVKKSSDTATDNDPFLEGLFGD